MTASKFPVNTSEKIKFLFDEKRYEQVLKFSEKKLKVGKASPCIFKYRGLAFAKLGKHELATESFIKLKQLDPNHKGIDQLILKSHEQTKFYLLFNKFKSGDSEDEILFELGNSITQNFDGIDKDFILKEGTSLIELYNELMKRDGSVDPSKLSLVIFNHLKKSASFIRAANSLIESKTPDKALEAITYFSSNTLFCDCLKYTICIDLEIETIIKLMRKRLFEFENIEDCIAKYLPIINAISIQSFLNEYIYDVSEAEMEKIEFVKKKIENDEQNICTMPSSEVFLLTLYVDVSDLPYIFKEKLRKLSPEIYEEIVKNSEIEIRLSEDIPCLSSNKDSVSSKVQEQYEESPYPRWKTLNFPTAPVNLEDIVKNSLIKCDIQSLTQKQPLEVLVAGCGTGKQPINLAKSMANVKIDAIDLSLKSLSFAKRKSKELQIENISFFQDDILNLPNQRKKYDFIACGGVLHHMEEPKKGLQILSEKLNNEGLLFIALYSTLARQNIKRVQEGIKLERINPHDAEVRYLRELLKLKLRNDPITKINDFYSSSSFRDLFLHVQEHTFSCLELKKLLKSCNLKFCGFSLPNKTILEFSSHHRDFEDFYSLDAWHAYEQKQPNLFLGMYNFYCQKIV